MTTYSEREMMQIAAQLPRVMADVPRYEPTGRADIQTGAPEVIDTWTGAVGVYIGAMGMGFCRGGYIDRFGRVAWSHPSDNPLQGVRF